MSHRVAHGCQSWGGAGEDWRDFPQVLFLDQTTATSWKHHAHAADPEAANPQCFAKAGKMEPNHLLNGFGPLQPAVAMLWWLPELPLSQSLRPTAALPDDGGFRVSGWNVPPPYDTLLFHCLPNKSRFQPNFAAVHFLEWVLPLCRRVDWYSGDTISGCFKNSRGGRAGWVGVGWGGQTCCVRYFRNTALTYLWENARLSR